MGIRRGMALGVCCCAASAAQPASAAAALEIEVLSNRADLVSAGDALVAVDLPAGTDPSTVRVTAGDADVTDAFAVRPDGRFEGLRDRPRAGSQRASAPSSRTAPEARITITNHPNGGPVFSGPQVQPWVCQASAVDEQCNQPAELRVPVQVLDHRRSSRPMTRPARPRTSPPRPPTRARRSPSSSAPRPATRTATSTRSPSSSTPSSPGSRGRRRSSGTTSF